MPKENQPQRIEISFVFFWLKQNRDDDDKKMEKVLKVSLSRFNKKRWFRYEIVSIGIEIM